MLAEGGIDIFVTDLNGNNALHIAAKKNFLNIVKMLISSKYPLNVQNDQGMTALSLAAKKGNLKVIKAL